MIDWRTSKLIDRIGWAKANLEPVRTDYCVVYEDIDMKCAAVMHPDPHCMAMLCTVHAAGRVGTSCTKMKRVQTSPSTATFEDTSCTTQNPWDR